MKCYTSRRRKGCQTESDEFNFPDDLALDARLEILMAKYKSIRNDFPDNCFYDEIKLLPTLEEAILFAAGAVSPTYGKHSHQHRISKSILEKYGYNLLDHEEEISLAKSFDELHSLLSKYQIPGIGPLAIYDTAVRLGVYLGGIAPEVVYLHSGTKEGAIKILGKIKGNTIRREYLPAIFQDPDLMCDDIETFLCIYKYYF